MKYKKSHILSIICKENGRRDSIEKGLEGTTRQTGEPEKVVSQARRAQSASSHLFLEKEQLFLMHAKD